MKNRNKNRKPLSSLRIIASILILSGFIRVTTQSNVAFAEDALVPETTQSTEGPAILGIPFKEDAIETLLTAFQAREARLIAREQELDGRETFLTEAEERVTSKIAELTEIEAKLAGTLAIADSAAENDLSRLTTVYENMKPRDAAALFSEMAPGFAAGFLGMMQPESAAAIMTELDPQIAHTISVMLAGRNANAFIAD